MPDPAFVIGIDPSPTGAAYAMLDHHGALSNAGPYGGAPCIAGDSIVYIVERIVPFGRVVGHDIFSSLENGLHIAEMAHAHGSLVYYVPCRTMRDQFLPVGQRHPRTKGQENADTRILKELGVRGYLKWDVKTSGAVYVTEPKCLGTDHCRDALVYALLNYRAPENQKHRFPDCLNINLLEKTHAK